MFSEKNLRQIDIDVTMKSKFKEGQYRTDLTAITSSYKLNIINEQSSGFVLEDIPNIKVKASKVDGYKCQRCWKYEEQLIDEEICKRCHEAIN